MDNDVKKELKLQTKYPIEFKISKPNIKDRKNNEFYPAKMAYQQIVGDQDESYISDDHNRNESK